MNQLKLDFSRPVNPFTSEKKREMVSFRAAEHFKRDLQAIALAKEIDPAVLIHEYALKRDISKIIKSCVDSDERPEDRPGAFTESIDKIFLPVTYIYTLIEKALSEYGKIFPCGRATRLDECFLVQAGRLQFWFNDRRGSTHMVSTPAADKIQTECLKRKG